MAARRRTELAVDAPAMALRRRRPGARPVHHTDRGCQYTAAADRALLTAHDVTTPMSRAGACPDNAMTECCFATRKAELGAAPPWTTHRVAGRAVLE